MTNINHNRPTLRLLDNYKRELRSLSHSDKISKVATEETTRGRKKRMPDVSPSAQQIILSMFDAADRYYQSFSKFLQTLSPEAEKSIRKKGTAFRRELDHAQAKLIDECVKLVVEALREKIEGKNGVMEWLIWFQDDAQNTNDSGLLNILEIGVRPAFKKIEVAIDEGVFRQNPSTAGC